MDEEAWLSVKAMMVHSIGEVNNDASISNYGQNWTKIPDSESVNEL